MNSWEELQWNWTEFCGNENFTIWTSNHQDLTNCFQTLCLQIPILALIAIVSAYYAGKFSEWTIRTSREKFILKVRMLITFFLAITPAIRLALQVCNNSKSLFVIDYWFTAVECFSWFAHFCYVCALRNRLGVNLRGPLILCSFWTLYFVTSAIHTRSLFLNYSLIKSAEIFSSLVFAVTMMLLQTLYGLTLIPTEDSYSRRNTVGIIDQDDIAFNSLLSRYVRFREDFDPHYLGTAAEGSGLVSKFLFIWVNRLVDKGASNLLNGPDDVFDLPDELSCSNLHDKLQNFNHGHICTSVTNANTENQICSSLVQTLHRCYAKEFYGVGILKFMADIAGFASPLFLHELLNYIDDQSIPLIHGYLYAAGIFFASLFGSFCTVHFDFFIGKIGLKLQGSLIAIIYRKILLLSPSVFRQTSVGEIVNHVSVDMERIAQSCLSFHAVWSIPFQLGVTLYLLYVQVGFASLAGVACSIILIPLNKVIAVKIGTFSSRMMAEKDKRVALMSEIIKGIRVIKLHVWEEHFISKVLGIRLEEIKYLKYRKYLDALCVFFWATTPVMLSTITFSVYVYFGGKLNSAKVFTSLALLNMLIVPLNAFPWVLNGLVEAWVSVKRVSSFLQLDEIDSWKDESIINNGDISVKINKGVFSWTNEKLLLTNIDLLIKKGQLVGIIGSVGSGKSSLLSAILCEIRKINGEIFIEDCSDGISFVSQTPWIQQCSIRDNILFGRPYNANYYKKVLEACALMDDINAWPNGDFEVVGEAGSTLSGGQKARIALARAVYQESQIYLLDDVLSAVDRQVAHHIYHECISKLLAGTTRILVTHATELLSSTDQVILMEKGTIVQQGPALSMLKFLTEETGKSIRVEESTIPEETDTSRSNDDSSDIREDLSSNHEVSSETDKIREGICDKDIEKEVSASGVVTFAVYFSYWKAMGHMLALFIILSVIAMQVSRISVDWWLSVWVSVNTDYRTNVTDLYYFNRFEQDLIGQYASNIYYFLGVYSTLGTINSLIVIVRAFSFAYGGLLAASRIHKKLFNSVLLARMEFFQVSPLGRILNRFSSDTSVVDDALPFDLNILLAQFAAVIGVLVTAVYGIPWLCLFVAPLIPIYHWLQNRYRYTSRELKRITSVVTSPLFSHVSETLSGMSVIRAFRQSFRFIRESEEKVDALQKCKFSVLAAQAWLSIRLQMIGIALIGGVCVITAVQRHLDVAHSGFIGLAISYALTLTSSLGGVVNIFVETERKMVALERVNDYIENTKSESSETSENVILPFAWPSQGVVSFSNVYLKYRDADDVAYSLKNVTFETLAGEKIGIVGRTGAGKSSLFSSLFRLVEISAGTIRIDTVDITNIPLRKLRSKITIVPQDPFIFADTIRNNLDPLGEYDEFRIWETVSKCNMIPLITKLGGMNAELQNEGDSLSVGEKQLLCLIRAVLRNNKIICIDEATANVDSETDKHLQEVIRNSFKSSTVLIIAHRVQSIIDCDRILVMGDGEVLEFDSPTVLLQNTESNFSKMINRC